MPSTSKIHKRIKKGNLIAKDSIFHALPLIILILIFTPLVRRTKKTNRDYLFRKNFKGRKCTPLESNYFILSCVPALILAILYTSFGDPEKSYRSRKIDFVIAVVLILSVFCSSYHIYFSWSKFVLGFK